MADFQFTQSGAQIQADLNLTENLQDAFSTSATYAVGDLVIYNSKIYKCHTAVSVAGAWTGSTNWTEVNLDSLLTSMTAADIDLAISAEIITTSITHGTATGDSVIAGTATVTITPNEGYALPSSVTVVGATSSYNSSTGVILLSSATGEVSITAECEEESVLPTPKANLNSYTWEEVKQLADAVADNTLSQSDLSSTYNIAIGDTKSSTINGETHNYRLIGLKHDLDVNSDYIGFTFEQVDLMTNTYVMKSSMSSTDSWQNSDLKTTLEGFTVASDLAAVITPAKKVCANNVSTGTPTYNYINSTNGLWIESETEVAGTQSYTIGGTVEGSEYAYYVNGGSRIKQKSGSDYFWWLRSPYNWNNVNLVSNFAGVSIGGDELSNNSNFDRGMAPCFCI